MKLKLAAIIATVLVMAAGIALVLPLYLGHNGTAHSQPRLMLAFSVQASPDADDWCRDLSAFLNAQDIPAAVFFVGQVAEHNPGCLSYFNDKVDIGSQTYDYSNLTTISDYSQKLQTVQKGKSAVDQAGRLSSHIFRAPFEATDQDIYSLLSRSDIQADFSYASQYNLYRNGQFLKYDAATYQARDYPLSFFFTLAKTENPVIIFFDNSYPVSNISALISNLKKLSFEFINASELADMTLTDRRVVAHP